MPEWFFLLQWSYISFYAMKYDVDPVLIGAIVWQESKGRECATRYEPNYKWLYQVNFFAKENNITQRTETIHQQISWGLMQVMGAVCREYGYMGPLNELCKPELALDYGVKHLKKGIDRYDKLDDAIASYNGGHRVVKLFDGEYENQKYVDSVKALINQLNKEIL